MIGKYYCPPIFFFVLINYLLGQPSMNVELFININRGDTRYSGCWSYISASGQEYALIGARTGTAVYAIDDPSYVVEVGFISGPETNWREITTIGHFAYVVTDAEGSGHGMQVIDLSFLPDSVRLVTKYTATFTRAHIIQKSIDSDEQVVYVAGTSTSRGVHILDVSDPANPAEMGLYAPGYYIHDCHIRGNLLFAAAFYERELDIVDISDKSNPVLVGKITYNGKNTHSSSTTEDSKYLFVADEADGFPARVFNIEDLDNPIEVAQFTSNQASLVHNPYVKGDFCYVSHNTEGLRVYDITDPTLPVEVGYYDTWDGPSGGFNGLWSACPYFPSGKIIGGNRHDGLYVWTFNQTKASRIYGLVVDSLSGLPIAGAFIEVMELLDTTLSNSNGNFKKGVLEGIYNLRFSKPGYLAKQIEIELSQGDSVWFEVSLQKEEPVSSNKVIKSIPQLNVYPNPSIQGEITVDLTGFGKADRLKVFNQLGMLITTYFAKGKKELKISLAEQAHGNFFLALMDTDRKIIGAAKIQLTDKH